MLIYDDAAEGARKKREWVTGFDWLTVHPCGVSDQDAYELTKVAERLLDQCAEALAGARVMLQSQSTPNYHAVAPVESALLRALEAMACLWHIGPQDEGKASIPTQPGSLVWATAVRLGLMDVEHPLKQSAIANDAPETDVEKH